MREPIKKEIYIEDNFSKPAFWLGDRFFALIRDRRADGLCISPPCPVCGSASGRGKITYAGLDKVDREYDCPYCMSRSGSVATFNKWTIGEFYVRKLEFRLPQSVAAYKKGQILIGNATLKAFMRTGRGANDIEEIYAPRLDDIDSETPKHYDSQHTRYCYSTKALAKKALSYVVEKEKERLAEVNKEYGTHYEYPWD